MAAIVGRARRYGLHTDASHRFERGVDPSTTVAHIEYLTRLIVEICGTPSFWHSRPASIAATMPPSLMSLSDTPPAPARARGSSGTTLFRLR